MPPKLYKIDENIPRLLVLFLGGVTKCLFFFIVLLSETSCSLIPCLKEIRPLF